MKARRIVAAASFALCAAAAANPDGLDHPLTRTDLNRALSIARWPRTDAERAQFHKRYVVGVNDPPVDYWTVAQIEVVTPFRRVELMAEEHARANDLWGRGGLRDVEEAIRPWKDRVAVIAHLRLRSDRPYIGGVPQADVVLGASDALAPIDVRRTDMYANCGGDTAGCPVVGGTIEALFDGASIGQRTLAVGVLWNGKMLTRVSIDFASLN